MSTYRIVNNPEYTLLKSKYGDKTYIPAMLFQGKRRDLHRAFTRARDAMNYRERVMRRVAGK